VTGLAVKVFLQAYYSDYVEAITVLGPASL
jgi:hypothetical protein